MALITCPNCLQEYTDFLDACPHCGQPKIVLIICPECHRQISHDLPSCPYCGYIFRKNLRVIPVSILKPVHSAGKLWNDLNGKTHIYLTQIQKIIGFIMCVALSIMLLTITGWNILNHNYKERIDAIHNGQVIEIQAWLQDHKSAYKAQALQKEINVTLQQNINSSMESGDYVNAQMWLNALFSGDDLGNLKENIVYESIALSCAVGVKPYFKNPQSFQFNSVEFYNNGDIIPCCVARCSGQNGFGGYTSSYSYFVYSEAADNMEFIGSCTSLFSGDNSDTDEMLISYLINDAMKNPKVGSVDVSRLNRVLAADTQIQIDLSQYVEFKKQET